MRAKLNKPQRRRSRAVAELEPGERGVVWEVRGHHRAGHSQTIGYLVTDRERCPRPVAFVLGIGARPLATAAAIRDNPRRLAAARQQAVRDYRGFSQGGRRRRVTFPRELVGYWLVPIDRLGRPVRGRGCFPWGMYSDGGQLGRGFMMFDRESSQANCIFGPASTDEPRVTWRKAARAASEKSGTPAIPSAPSGGARKSRKGGRQASA